ncbi:MAG: putative porin [Aquabacterium sp.]|nr:putative porin [Aquabacterium sp.]
MKSLKSSWWPTLTALSLAVCATTAHADERASLEALRQTTLSLINALVDKGVLTRDAVDIMLKQAEAAPVVANTEAKPVQRIPYVSEATKAQIRNEVKEEVLTLARAERWGVPNATPAWVDRIKLDGDFRFRFQGDHQDSRNTPPINYLASEDLNDGTIRAPDFGSYLSGNSSQATASTVDSRNRERIRLRLSLTAKVTDEVGVGIRLATGSTNDRVSTNQSLGQSFNKYPLLVDRAFARVTPVEGVDVLLGRFPNPWFGTDMVWSENLNFEGMATTARWDVPEATFVPFATVGAFPLREDGPPLRGGRWLYGAQAGASWLPAARTRLKFGMAYYQYKNLEGQQDTDYTTQSGTLAPGKTYGQYEYPVGMRQKGNTLFETNPSSPTNLAPIWGLAYKFKPLVLTASAELTHFSPYSLLLTGEFVKNTAFDAADFQRRSGLNLNPGGKDKGYQLKAALGALEVRDQGDWQGVVSYRYLGSDAVLDAFNDSDLGLGGTNVQGYTLGMTYGVYRNTALGVRYLSSRTIDSPINDAFEPNAKYRVNSLQVDFNVRF